ncbi:AcrR family transcriptional regulator [Streptomyces sp. LBL]|nr:AcrR family transcriptional regulator [Streptomyces sp. LBL]
MGRKRGFDETTVLDVVRDRFWITGFDGTSTYDLMEATGLGIGSIYKAFGNKHDLCVRTTARTSSPRPAKSCRRARTRCSPRRWPACSATSSHSPTGLPP